MDSRKLYAKDLMTGETFELPPVKSLEIIESKPRVACTGTGKQKLYLNEAEYEYVKKFYPQLLELYDIELLKICEPIIETIPHNYTLPDNEPHKKRKATKKKYRYKKRRK